jgi:hypothetical protein
MELGKRIRVFPVLSLSKFQMKFAIPPKICSHGPMSGTLKWLTIRLTHLHFQYQPPNIFQLAVDQRLTAAAPLALTPYIASNMTPITSSLLRRVSCFGREGNSFKAAVLTIGCIGK